MFKVLGLLLFLSAYAPVLFQKKFHFTAGHIHASKHRKVYQYCLAVGNSRCLAFSGNISVRKFTEQTKTGVRLYVGNILSVKGGK